MLRPIRSLSAYGKVVSFRSGAGPSRDELYREIVETGHLYDVEAPSLIPRRSGEQ